mmetsp:Transcript_6984/g.7750  ORF Transcript_6984/g.7750 Transcript_6984/m.7750 type:complete len:86 (+) Transcript_6984:931-1188(+)
MLKLRMSISFMNHLHPTSRARLVRGSTSSPKDVVLQTTSEIVAAPIAFYTAHSQPVTEQEHQEDKTMIIIHVIPETAAAIKYCST